MTKHVSRRESDDATLVLQRYLKAQEDKDLDALVSCWHPDVEVVHPLRPDRSWRGVDTYRQAWALIWGSNLRSRFDVVSADVVGNRIYIEAYVEHADGTMMPSMNILEVESGRIRRGRVYTDRPVLDGVPLGDFVRGLNPAPTPPTVQPKDAADRFFAACGNRDFDELNHVLHADFEMIVPQKPARGFKGRAQEIANLTYLFDTHPDLSIAVLRKAVNGNEIWTEMSARGTGLEMAAIIIWEVDAATDTIIGGRYYSEPVDRNAPDINEFLRGMGRPPPPEVTTG
jgi:ketosteroid isomerase-like protein